VVRQGDKAPYIGPSEWYELQFESVAVPSLTGLKSASLVLLNFVVPTALGTIETAACRRLTVR